MNTMSTDQQPATTRRTRPTDRFEQALHDATLERLRRSGLRYTAGRQRIVELLCSSGSPLTVEHLIALDPQMPMSSVYRDLNCLCDVGILERLALLHDRNHFRFRDELLGRRELHFVCNDCSRVTTVESTPVVDKVVAQAERHATTPHFIADRGRLAMFGRCAACRT
jgi:Fe2+ or Zn2+ uptake regulation protein